VTFTLPTALQSEDDDAALRLLTRYFAPVVGDPGSYTGAAWDDWDPSGRREQDFDEFTADDCMAVTLLSVDIPGQAAHTLLVKDRVRYSALLAEVGPDRDLVELAESITDDWPASVLYRAVRELPKVGRTKTSKLLARKRPALIPIWDSVIGGVTQAGDYFWEPLRQQLRANDAALHRRLLRLRDQAGLSASVTALRVFDVVCWMEGKDKGYKVLDEDAPAQPA
jgi:hypothetical protein